MINVEAGIKLKYRKIRDGGGAEDGGGDFGRTGDVHVICWHCLQPINCCHRS